MACKNFVTKRVWGNSWRVLAFFAFLAFISFDESLCSEVTRKKVKDSFVSSSDQSDDSNDEDGDETEKWIKNSERSVHSMRERLRSSMRKSVRDNWELADSPVKEFLEGQDLTEEDKQVKSLIETTTENIGAALKHALSAASMSGAGNLRTDMIDELMSFTQMDTSMYADQKVMAHAIFCRYLLALARSFTEYGAFLRIKNLVSVPGLKESKYRKLLNQLLQSWKAWEVSHNVLLGYIAKASSEVKSLESPSKSSMGTMGNYLMHMLDFYSANMRRLKAGYEVSLLRFVPGSGSQTDIQTLYASDEYKAKRLEHDTLLVEEQKSLKRLREVAMRANAQGVLPDSFLNLLPNMDY